MAKQCAAFRGRADLAGHRASRGPGRNEEIWKDIELDAIGKHVSSYGLDQQGLGEVRVCHWNLGRAALYEQAIRRQEGRLSKDGALVVETGSALSEITVACRELGVPVVVAAKNATLQILDGSIVEVDGLTGIVTVIEDPPTDKQAPVELPLDPWGVLGS